MARHSSYGRESIPAMTCVASWPQRISFCPLEHARGKIEAVRHDCRECGDAMSLTWVMSHRRYEAKRIEICYFKKPGARIEIEQRPSCCNWLAAPCQEVTQQALLLETRPARRGREGNNGEIILYVKMGEEGIVKPRWHENVIVKPASV